MFFFPSSHTISHRHHPFGLTTQWRTRRAPVIAFSWRMLSCSRILWSRQCAAMIDKKGVPCYYKQCRACAVHTRIPRFPEHDVIPACVIRVATNWICLIEKLRKLNKVSSSSPPLSFQNATGRHLGNLSDRHGTTSTLQMS